MSVDPRLAALLERCREAKLAGQAVSVEQLCRDCPELLDELRRHLDGGVTPGNGSVDMIEQATVPPPPANAPGSSSAPGRYEFFLLTFDLCFQ